MTAHRRRDPTARAATLTRLHRLIRAQTPRNRDVLQYPAPGSPSAPVRGAGGGRLEQPVCWSSSDPDVVTVVGNGTTATVAGWLVRHAEVTVSTANGLTAHVTVRVRVTEDS